MKKILSFIFGALLAACAVIAISRFTGLPDWAQKPNDDIVVTKLFEIELETVVKDGIHKEYADEFDLPYEKYTYEIAKTNYIITINNYLGDSNPTIKESHFILDGPKATRIAVTNCKALYFEVTGLNNAAVKKSQTLKIPAIVETDDKIVSTYIGAGHLYTAKFTSIEKYAVYGIKTEQPVLAK